MALMLSGPQSRNRPSCWGRREIYDANDRECRGCGFQASCRDQVIKSVSALQPTIPPTQSQPVTNSYYQNFLPPQIQQQPALAPVPFNPVVPTFNPVVPVVKFNPPQMQQMQPAQPQMFAQPPQMFSQVRPVPVAQQPPPVPQIPQPMVGQQRPVDWYGRTSDPLHFALFQPPPFRPQMEGESFMERVGKNLALDLGTMALFHLGLALRQMVLPPQPVPPPVKVVK